MSTAFLDKLTGSWKMELTPKAKESIAAYSDAMNMPPEMKKKAMENDMKLECSYQGQDITLKQIMAGETATYNCRLGEKSSSTVSGMEYEYTFTLEGDVLLGEHSICGQKSTSRRYFNADGTLQVEMSAPNGVKTNFTLFRI